LKSRDAFAIAALAAVVAILVAPHAPAGVPVLVAACTALLAGWSNRAHHDPAPPHQWPDTTRPDTTRPDTTRPDTAS
jgi:L-alanine-DL-glutamate epimerase-like enolase superfamily enzyme